MYIYVHKPKAVVNEDTTVINRDMAYVHGVNELEGDYSPEDNKV